MGILKSLLRGPAFGPLALSWTAANASYEKRKQGGSGTELELETGTAGTVFPETEIGTAGTVFQEPKPEPEQNPFLQKNRQNRKPEPLEPFHPQTITEPNRTEASLPKGNRAFCVHKFGTKQMAHNKQHCKDSTNKT